MSDLFPETVETDRLRLERLTTDDLFELYDHANVDAPHVDEITEYVTWDPHRSLKETRDFVAQCEQWWDDGEAATYVARPKEGEPLAGEFGGTTGFGIEWDTRVAELGLWLREPLWGRGYSAERALALMATAFERLDLDAVAVTHVTGNEQSRRAIEKYVDAAGGREEGTLRNGIAFSDGSVHDVVRYTVTAEEFVAADTDAE